MRRPLWQLTRPWNALLAAFGAVAGAGLSRGASHSEGLLIALAALAAFCITAFGNVLNDLRDRGLDRVAHPARPLPSGKVSLRAAARLSGILLALGLAAAAAVGLWTLVLAVSNVALLFLYEWRLKREGLPGNVLVSFLVGSTFLFGAMAIGTPPEGWRFVWVAAIMAFFLNLAREIAKDIEDVDADRSVRRTLPMQVGKRTAGGIAAACALVGVLASWPFLGPDQFVAWSKAEAPVFLVFFALLAIADLAALFGATRSIHHARRAQLSFKVAMASALLAFLLPFLFPGTRVV